jgi:basic amino acid/polyamine antiporter, APA family
VSMAAVLLVFQYGQPRIFFAMARDGLLPQWAARVDQKTRIPYTTTLVTGVVVAIASLIGDAAETYDLTNIGTLFAFALVCAGVIMLRINEPQRERPFKVPFVWVTAPLGILACVYIMLGLPPQAWTRFGWWLLIGIAIYVAYGYRHSHLRRRV